MRTRTLASLLAAVSLLAGAAAGAAALTGDDTVSPIPDGSGDHDEVVADFPSDEVREHARGYLGMGEGDLPDEVRIARRGDDVFMLTEDYVLGRSTVELDDADGMRVVSVTVELPGGPETFVLEAS